MLKEKNKEVISPGPQKERGALCQTIPVISLKSKVFK